MKVISSEDNELVFDNGLKILGEGERDCCAYNYIDFEQFEVGAEFPSMTAGQFIDTINIQDDGFAMKDIHGIPKWAQARSSQNGYYSDITEIFVEYAGKTLSLGKLRGDQYE